MPWQGWVALLAILVGGGVVLVLGLGFLAIMRQAMLADEPESGPPPPPCP